MNPMSRFIERISVFRKRSGVSRTNDPIGQLIAVLGLLLAAGGLFVSYQSMLKSDKIAAQALEMSRITNEIALGTKREPGILEFPYSNDKGPQFDFTDRSALKEELKQVIRLSNHGKRPVAGLSADLIGIEPLTYSLSNPGASVRPLPALTWKLEFNSAVLPSGAVAIDVRKPLLLYLQRLTALLDNQNATYTTSINFVISTRSPGESDFMGMPDASKMRDRELITIRFKPDIVKTEDARAILSSSVDPHRVYTP